MKTKIRAVESAKLAKAAQGKPSHETQRGVKYFRRNSLASIRTVSIHTNIGEILVPVPNSLRRRPYAHEYSICPYIKLLMACVRVQRLIQHNKYRYVTDF